MEPPSSETSDDDLKPPSTTTTTEQQQQQQQQQQTTALSPRSYECNYCKRGFTNAQALGGHMNIHRKDKTKFKHSTTVEPPSATRPRLNPSTTTTTTTAGNLQPLPLFDHRDTAVRANIHHPGDPLSPEGDVDLELRLGHVEPPPEPSSEPSPENTTTTRKFF